MWKEVTRAFFITTVVLTVAATFLACCPFFLVWDDLKRTGSFLTDELPVLLWLAVTGVLSVWVIATAARLIMRRYAKPRQPDGPETDYHDFHI